MLTSKDFYSVPFYLPSHDEFHLEGISFLSNYIRKNDLNELTENDKRIMEYWREKMTKGTENFVTLLKIPEIIFIDTKDEGMYSIVLGAEITFEEFFEKLRLSIRAYLSSNDDSIKYVIIQSKPK